jgi:peptidoglycan/LPS O-acetylase OafA/YrhL
VLGMLRTQLPSTTVKGDEKLLLLALYLLLSELMSWAIARFYAQPLNRRIRRWWGTQAGLVTEKDLRATADNGG